MTTTLADLPGFNPRLREGGDLFPSLSSCKTGCFNPRLREGGDGFTSQALPCFISFQSTPPRGRRLVWATALAVLSVVSIHASAREATVLFLDKSHSIHCFNPRLREGGDFYRRFLHGIISFVSIHASAREATDDLPMDWLDTFVSIHASAREATNKLLEEFQGCFVSIHASAREATTRSGGKMANTTLFQSTPPRGRRRLKTLSLDCSQLVSIHASAREATARGATWFYPVSVSIHASAREAT